MAINKIPLCVDLDGTLVKTDTLLEAAVLLLKRNPLYFFIMPFWLFQGKAFLKYQIARRVKINVSSLPFNNEFLSFLREEHASGRTLILTTASNSIIANQIAEHLGIFDSVIASDGKSNLKGQSKLKVLLERYGELGFDYAADCYADIPIWQHSRHAILVAPARYLTSRIRKIVSISKVFDNNTNSVRIFFEAIRVHQWVKNLLIFAPVIASHQVTSPMYVLKCFYAFVVFCFCSSSAYLLNDLLDLESDRKNPTKKFRPLASGDLPLFVGMVGIPLLLILSLLMSSLLLSDFTIVVICYFIITLIYSLYLKRKVIVDVLVLAFLYTFRIVAGHMATDVAYSAWLIAFAMFIFLSLAFLKRFSELAELTSQNKDKSEGRGYISADTGLILHMGITSGYLSILILALYINSKEVVNLYKNPMLLWALCPVLIYWVGYVWFQAYRGNMNEDPIIFALKDKVSYLIACASLVIIFFASVGW